MDLLNLRVVVGGGGGGVVGGGGAVVGHGPSLHSSASFRSRVHRLPQQRPYRDLCPGPQVALQNVH